MIAPEIPTDDNDPRLIYPELTQESADRAWPCSICLTRRDEHADQPEKGKFPELDITDHKFQPAHESNLFKHAYRELNLLGEEPGTIVGYLRMIEIFASMGHSGGSASVFIPTLTRLLQFENLKPLTDDPDEWHFHGDDLSGHPGGLWQSRRNSEAFSHDGGKTYTLLSERDWNGPPEGRAFTDGPTHESEKSA